MTIELRFLARLVMATEGNITNFQVPNVHLLPTVLITLISWLIRLLLQEFVRVFTS